MTKKPISLLKVVAVLGFLPSCLWANPSGGNVAAGSAAIAGQGTSAVKVTQASNVAIINWQTFSINSGESTSFLQPSASSAALNRVLGGQTSVIDGSLSANGQIYLVNGNGVVVGPGGVVTANAFTASTRDISNADFLSGNLHFTGSSDAGVQNLGTITALGGDVVLIGKTVDNEGTINAANGTAGLIAGDDVLLAQKNGDGSTITVSPTALASGASAKTGVKNGGTIAAAAAELKAANGNIYALAIQNSGIVRATTVKHQGGHIWLTSDSGTVSNSGTLDASATAAGGAGGTVTLKSKAGTVSHTGRIIAQGGPGGAGGSAEISGATLVFTGTVDLTAPGGTTGNLLLDPDTLEIIGSGATGTIGSLPAIGDSTINASDLDTALASANVTLQANISISVNALVVANNSLALDAPTLNLNQPIVLNGSLSGTATTVNVGASGLVQNGVDASSTTSIPTINLAAGATYDFSYYGYSPGAVLINKSLNLEGNGAILNGQNQVDLIEIGGSSSGVTVTVNLNNLTLEGGNGAYGLQQGGAMDVNAEYGNSPTVTINNSTISGNSGILGGAIYNGNSTLTINNSTISGNSAYYDGGGIDNEYATLTINNSTIQNNNSGYGDSNGGGINNDYATLTINNSTISGNTAYHNGGGIANDGGNATINNSTISGNSADGDGGYGSGIYNGVNSGNATVTITGSTITNNTGGSAAIFNDQHGTVIIGDTILADNYDPSYGVGIGLSGVYFESDYLDGEDGDETLISTGYNLIGQNGSDGGFGPENESFTGFGPGDMVLGGNINSVLQTDGNGNPLLANNGGPTQTIALVGDDTTNPAIGTGGIPAPYAIDQRGFARNSGGQSIGAYEANSIGNPFVVTSTADDAPAEDAYIGELRTALTYASANPTFDPTITFASSPGQFDGGGDNTISLAQGELVINSSLTLDASSVGGVTIDAGYASRVLEIDGANPGITVNLNALTLQNGNSGYSNAGGLLVSAENGNSAAVTITNSTIQNNKSYGYGNGGGIYIDGSNGGSANVSIVDSTISHNSAESGGGIVNEGSLTITGSTLSSNEGYYYGGGIANEGALTITGSTLSSNYAYQGGGGIYNDGTFTLIDSMITSNTSFFGAGIDSDANLIVIGTTISGNMGYHGGGVYNSGVMTVADSTISDNSAGDNGGAVDNAGTATIADSMLSDNSASFSGGAIYNDGVAGTATLTIGNSTISGNTAYYSGGGIYNDGDSGTATMTISNSTVTDNSASSSSSNGGGIDSDGDSGTAALTISNSTISGNSASSFGGGIYSDDSLGGSASLTINTSTISGNSAGSGGGIYNDGSNDGSTTLTISSSTISGNSANNGDGGGIDNEDTLMISDSTIAGNSTAFGKFGGGGIYNNGTLTISSSTITGNSAYVLSSGLRARTGGYGGGIYNGSNATLTIGDSILAGNTADRGPSSSDLFNSGTLVDNGYNLYGENGSDGGFNGNGGTSNAPAASDILLTGSIATVLQTDGNGVPLLADNGGPTQTIALVVGGPAIDAGDPALIGTTDQRGVVRGSPAAMTGTESDIGAYEAAILNVTVDATADNQTITYGEALPTLTYTVTSGPSDGLTGAPALITPEINVGVYTGDIGQGTLAPANSEYLLDFTPGTLTIDPATLTITANSTSKTYGQMVTFGGTEFTSLGLQNNETVGSVMLTSAGAARTANVAGSPYAIVASGATGGTFDASNYTISYVNGALTVNPASLTITANSTSKTYGQTVTFGGTEFTSLGLQNNETVGSVMLASAGAASTANVAGSPYAIVASNATGGTFDASNYSISYANGALTISPATLTYTANAVSMIYGATDPAFSGTVTGFVNGQNQTIATTGTLAFGSTANSTSNVGSYAIDGSGLTANNGNYVFVQAMGNSSAFTISPATLTETANAATMSYGGTDPAFSGTVTGFVNGQNQGSATTGTLVFGSTANSTSNVGSYAIKGSGLTANNGNYIFVQATGNATAFSITPATLTDTANTATMTYGGTDPAFSGTVTGFVNGQAQGTATTGMLVFGSTANSTSNVGSYAINGSGLTANNGNYVFVQATGNATAFTINPAMLTETANTATMIYGGTDPAFSGTVTGFVNGQNQTSATTGTLAFGSTANSTSNVGSYAVNGSGLTANNGNYTFVQAAGNATAFTINPAPLTETASAATMIYGGTDPAFSGTVTGFVNGQNQSSATTGTLVFGSTANSSSNVGSYAINGSGLTAYNGNYVFVQATGNATAFTISPATLTETANAATMIYGGTDPAFSGMATGFVNGQSQSTATTGTLAFGSTANSSSNVGSYAINGSGLTANNGNYVFVQSAGNATAFTINPATLTETANAATMIYGGTDPAFSGTVTGFVNGQNQSTATTGTLAFGSTANSTSNVGSYAVNGSVLTANSGNYIFVQASGNSTAFTINPATLTETANAATMIYGGTVPAFSGTVTGFVNGQNQNTATTGTLVFGSTANSMTNVGSYAINGSGLTANNGNYIFAEATGNATAFSIAPATLTDTANTATMIYGGTDPAFSGTVTGFVDGQTQATATTGTLTFGSSANGLSNVGSYAINGSGLTAKNGNYIFVQAAGNSTAFTINPATLTETANTATMIYGGSDPAFSGTVTGFVNGQNQTSATTGTLAFGSTASSMSNVGIYAINGSGLTSNNGNYTFVQASGNATAFSITPATLTYTANAATMIYGGTDPAFSGTVTGFVNGQTVGSATTGALAFTSSANGLSNVGHYAINGSGLTANNGNYTFVQAMANATAFNITPATLTYMANTATMIYGGTDPAFSGTITGFVNGQTQSGATTGTLAFTSSANGLSNVGKYAINGSGLTANNGNYTFVQAAGNATAFSITPATLTYTANAATMVYGGTDPAFSGTITGFVNGQTQSGATTGTLAFASSANGLSNVGKYAINGAGLTANNGNYTFVQAAANATAFSITPATLTYTANAATMIYGGTDPAFSGMVTGYVNGQTQSSATTGTLAFTSSANGLSNVGKYAINGSGLTANNGNYTFVQAAGNATAFNITPATLTYTANAATMIYGGTDPAFSGAVTGFMNGQTQSSATTGTLAFTSAANGLSNVGKYAINGGGLTANNGNYTFAQAAGNATAFSITPATLTYTANAVSILPFFCTVPTLSGTVTGFVNGQTVSTATTGTLVFTTTATSRSCLGTYAINGGGLTANNGNYVFVQAASNATAFTITLFPCLPVILPPCTPPCLLICLLTP